jgi:hypothetical protein
MALRYEIRLRGRVGDHLEAEVEPPSTLLSGSLTATDLQRLLARLEERGLEVVALRRLPDA